MALPNNERLERARLQYEILYTKANSNTDEKPSNGLDISVDSLNISNNRIDKSVFSSSSNYTYNFENKSFEIPSSVRDLRDQRKSDISSDSLFSNPRANINDNTLWDEKSSVIIALQQEVDRLKEKLNIVVGSAETTIKEVQNSQVLISVCLDAI
jgi:hypothetical protein